MKDWKGRIIITPKNISFLKGDVELCISKGAINPQNGEQYFLDVNNVCIRLGVPYVIEDGDGLSLSSDESVVKKLFSSKPM